MMIASLLLVVKMLDRQDGSDPDRLNATFSSVVRTTVLRSGFINLWRRFSHEATRLAYRCDHARQCNSRRRAGLFGPRSVQLGRGTRERWIPKRELVWGRDCGRERAIRLWRRSIRDLSTRAQQFWDRVLLNARARDRWDASPRRP